MSDSYYVGVVLTSHDNQQLATLRVSQFAVLDVPSDAHLVHKAKIQQRIKRVLNIMKVEVFDKATKTLLSFVNSFTPS